MPSTAIESNVSDHEGRLRNLERDSSQGFAEIHANLETIKKCLLGDLDKGTAGILSEFREVKKDLHECNTSILKIKDNLLPGKQITEDITTLKKEVGSLTRHRNYIWGAGITLWSLFNLPGFLKWLTGAK